MNNYTDETLAALIKSVEEDFEVNLKELQEKSKETEVKEETKVEKSEASEKPKLESASTETFDYDEEDMEEMNKMYSSMSKSEAKAHFDSLAKTLGVSGEEIKKSEEDKILKSENETLKGELSKEKEEKEELKKSLANIVATLKGKISVPQRKAITNYDYIAKSETEVKKPETKDASNLSSNEISQILSSKMREGTLSKSERELVVNFYDKKKTINDIKHLL